MKIVLPDLRIRHAFMLTAFIIVIINKLQAQSPPDGTKKFSYMEAIPPSPNAYAFAKYGDIPVGSYSGTANVDIPVWEVRGYDLKVPLSLSYHSGGIKVQEEASWVGLGWSLNAGGSITRITRGIADEIALYPYDFDSIELYKNYGGFLKKIADQERDGELDIFSYNAGGQSGKFIVYNQTAYMLGQKNVKINVSGGNGDPYAFRIFTDDGTIYDFGEWETSSPDLEALKQYRSAWYLTSIISASRLDTISFNYTPETIHKSSMGGFSLSVLSNGNSSYCGNGSYSGGVPVASTTIAARLTSISSARHTVIFKQNSTARNDLGSSSTSYALDSILVKDAYSDTVIKKFDFDFYSTSGIDADRRRIMLKSFSDVTDAQKLTHSFTYVGGILPAKNSYDFDHWGYYNGASNSTPVPKLLLLGGPGGLLDYVGDADREPSFHPEGMLEKIVYPTGGSSVFEYEQNTYGTVGAKRIIGHKETSAVGTNSSVSDEETFELGAHEEATSFMVRIGRQLYLPSGTYENDENTETAVTVVKLLSGGGEEVVTTLNSTEGGTYSSQVVFTLPPGNYKLVSHAYHLNTVALGSVDWEELSSTEIDHFETPGPGLRVKSITSSPGDSFTNSISKTYHYETDSGYATGVFTGQIPAYTGTSFSQNTGEDEFVCADCHFMTISSSARPTTMPASDYLVFYSSITEITESGDGSGKTVINYGIGGNDEPLLLKKTEFRSAGSGYVPLTETENTYGMSQSALSYYALSIGETKSYTCIDPHTEYTPFFQGLDTSWNFITRSVQRTYSSSVNMMEDTVTYSYNAVHHYPVQIVKSQPDLSRQKTILKYPADYTGVAAATAMQNAFVTGVPVEEQEWMVRGSSVLLGGIIREYETSLLKPKKLYGLELAAPVSGPDGEGKTSGKFNSLLSDTRYASRIEFDYNSANGLLKKQFKTGDVAYAYLYDRHNTMPSAQIFGADPSQVSYSGFEADSKGGWSYSGTPSAPGSGPAGTGIKIYSLSGGNITKSGLTSASNYTLTFLYASGASVTVTGGTQSDITTQTLPNGWIRSSRNITGTTSLTVSGTGNIDELRLCPSGAQMTTYTYGAFGVTSATDPQTITVHYNYDSSGRLSDIKDAAGKVVKAYFYNYRKANP